MNRSDVRKVLEKVSKLASNKTIKHMDTTIENIINKFHGRGSTEIKNQFSKIRFYKKKKKCL